PPLHAALPISRVPPTHHPPRPLERRALPEVGERPARQFRRIGRHLDLRESSAAQHRNADRARGAPEQPPARNPHGIHDTPPLADPLGIQAGGPTRNQRPRSTDQLTSPRSNREPAPAPATAARPAAATARSARAGRSRAPAASVGPPHPAAPATRRTHRAPARSALGRRSPRRSRGRPAHRPRLALRAPGCPSGPCGSATVPSPAMAAMLYSRRAAGGGG